MEIMLAMFITILINTGLSIYIMRFVTTQYVKKIEALQEKFLNGLMKAYVAEIKKCA
ncbi:MAG: hypothetical protein HFE75_04935 [Firmicutes bacterium]|jgi:hypothetical protein|nr:hypothetical protein [Bacillota bacterium]